MDKINLQLFNEAGTTNQDSGNAGGAAADSGAEKVALDGDGNVRLVYEDDDTAAGDEEGGKADPAAGDKGTPTGEQALYTPEEIRTTDFDKLDPKRLPPEMQAWYRSMQAPITRKNQELAESIKAAKEIADKLQQRPEKEVSRISPKEAYAREHQYLRHQVAAMFEVDPAKLPQSKSEWPGYMQDAYDDARADLRREAAVRQEAAEQQEALRQSVAQIEAKLRGMDNDAYEYAMKNIRRGDAEAVKKALLTGDEKTVADIFTAYRTEYHAQKNGIKTGPQDTGKNPPPKLESTGGGGQPEGKGLPDYGELGRMQSFEEKLAWLRRHGITP